MIEKTMYIANDGKAFEDEEDCREYEARIEFSDILQSITLFSEDGKVIEFGNTLFTFDEALDDAIFILIPSYLRDERIKYFSDTVSELDGKLFPTATGLYRWDYNMDEWVSFKAETHRLIEMWEPMLNIKITSERR